MKSPRGRRGLRSIRAASALRMRADGKSGQEIADALGVSRSYASALYTDPDGTKDRERKASYQGTCQTCGAPTSGADGPNNQPAQCAPCAAAKNHDNRYWTGDRCIAAICRYDAEFGHQPLAVDVLAKRPEWMAPVSAVQREFGSWAAGLQAAGFTSHIGVKIRKRGEGMSAGNHGYVILREGAGGWEVVGESPKYDRERALNDVLNGSPPDTDTRFVAVARGGWNPRTVRAVQKVVYEFADEA